MTPHADGFEGGLELDQVKAELKAIQQAIAALEVKEKAAWTEVDILCREEGVDKRRPGGTITGKRACLFQGRR